MKRALVALTVIGLALAGCAPTGTTDTQSITVFAAASLTDSFGEIAEAFEAENPGVTVTLNFGGSSSLATQIVEGAPADVFAAASVETMSTVGVDGVVFAHNTLEIAVPRGNPGGVQSLADLADPALAVAVCAVEVPCGAASQLAFERAGVAASVDTYEQDVRAVLTKVELGEVDAGLVYRTDVMAARDTVEGIEIADAPTTAYPIAAISDSSAAAAFVSFVLSDAGQKILQNAGFDAP